jgi:hypothetical protein
MLLWIWLALIGTAHAGAQHQNQVALRKESATSLRFDFQIDPAVWLHQLMQPQSSFPDFLKTHAALPEADFRKMLAQSLRKMEKDNFVHLPSGEKLALLQWQSPAMPHLQEMLQKNLLILGLPPQMQAHLEPIPLSAIVRSKKPLGRIQLSLSPVFHPILLQYQQDMVWFTQMIPASLIDL